jgi:chaperonin GroEL (HSP60 family)
VLLIGELLKQAERYLQEGSHPRVIVEVRHATRQQLVPLQHVWHMRCACA